MARPGIVAEALLIVALCNLATGCSGLIVRDDDSGMEKTAKVTARALLFVPTIGISEQTIYDLKEAERYEAWKNQAVSREASDSERHAYRTDQKLLNASEFASQELMAILAGDLFGASFQLADLVVLWFVDTDLDPQLRYLPPPKRALYPPIDRHRP
jgi:hypothetical protein